MKKTVIFGLLVKTCTDAHYKPLESYDGSDSLDFPVSQRLLLYKTGCSVVQPTVIQENINRKL